MLTWGEPKNKVWRCAKNLMWRAKSRRDIAAKSQPYRPLHVWFCVYEHIKIILAELLEKSWEFLNLNSYFSISGDSEQNSPLQKLVGRPCQTILGARSFIYMHTDWFAHPTRPSYSSVITVLAGCRPPMASQISLLLHYVKSDDLLLCFMRYRHTHMYVDTWIDRLIWYKEYLDTEKCIKI